MTSIYFMFIDSCSNPLNGCRVTLTPYDPPFVTGSFITFGGPLIQYTNSAGYVEYDSVVAGVYKVTVGNNNDNNPVALTNYTGTIFYIQVSEGAGLIAGSTCVIGQ